MRKLIAVLVVLTAPLLSATSLPPATDARMDILVNGIARPEYSARGTTYVEALKNQGYEIRLTNPYGVRVAVALSVDGLNTLDARHTDAKSARKWVLNPYETIVLRGWQTGNDQARRFFFTSEEKSYGAWLGNTANLGVISAAFFRERAPYAWRETVPYAKERSGGDSRNAPPPPPAPQAKPQAGLGGELRDNSPRAEAAPASESRVAKDNNEFAATGMGQAERHPVTLVSLDLEDSPAAVVTIRYEYRDALVALGVLPTSPSQDALIRREKSRGFTEYCPQPK